MMGDEAIDRVIDRALLRKIERLQAAHTRMQMALAKMFELEPDKPTAWRYDREEYAEIARRPLGRREQSQEPRWMRPRMSRGR